MKEIKGKNTKKPQVYATAASKTNTKSQGQREENRKDSGRLFGGDKESLKDSGRAFGGRKENNADVRKKRITETGLQKKGLEKTEHGSKGTKLCPSAGRCGGCQLIHLPYKKQLERKKKKLEDLLCGICTVYGMEGMENPWHYRNKVHAVFDHDRKGNPISGIYEAGSHRVVPVDRCLLEDEKADEIIVTIRELLKSFKIRTYDEDTGYGLLRHVLIRKGFFSGQIMVVLVTVSPVFPSKSNFVRALREKHPEITTIVQNINERNTSMVLGKRDHIFFGRGFIEDYLCGCVFRISPQSFYQINPVQTEKLYQKALKLADLHGDETVIDAYCGIGTIGIIAAKQAGKVIGVELNPEAVRDAVNNAKINHIQNIRFYCNDAGRLMQEMAESGQKADVVIMDPPRSGSTEEFMNAVKILGPQKVVYISCGPETLARDLQYFHKLGYQADGGWGYDLFPGTEHVETVVLLTQKNKRDYHVEIEIPIEAKDEAEYQKEQKKATYTNIKNYIKERYGVEVHSSYIAQVRRLCGLDMRECYNKSKKEIPIRVSQCPDSKAKYIREALAYFEEIR